MNCRICASTLVDESDPVCEACSTQLGITPLPELTRPARPCAGCNGMRFIRVAPRELSATGSDFVNVCAAPMTLTLVPRTTSKFFGQGRNVDEPSPLDGKGKLETFVCTGCGRVEWYCTDPQNIPIGPEYMSEIVDYTADKPYR